jgi:predicted DNA-binding ribbon-helix-helix protein
MCEFFVKADPILYESRTRSVLIHGVLTSIRLENLMWDTLARMAHDEGKSTNALIAAFHDEILQYRGEMQNFASFLRVTCLRYLQRRLDAADRTEAVGATLPTPASPVPVPLYAVGGRR